MSTPQTLACRAANRPRRRAATAAAPGGRTLASGRTAAWLMLLAVWLSCSNAPTFAQAKDAKRPPETPGRVRLVLPPVIYATPDIETNVYFENVALMLNPANFAFEVTCEKGLQMAERWAYTPGPDEQGEFLIMIAVRDEANEVVARASSTIRVTPKTAETAGYATVLLVGDSHTQQSIYPQHILDLSVRDPYMLLKFVGSRGPNDQPPHGELRHEGYRGWTAQAFVTLHGPLSRSGYHKRPQTGSPFVYDDGAGGTKLDFERYNAEFNGGKAPDLVTIQVGVNDTFTADDQTIDERIDVMIGYYDQLVEMVRRAGPKTRIGVVLGPPASTSQDGFRNYRGAAKQTRWQARRNYHRVVERLMNHYGGRTDDRVHLVPAYINLDTANHYPSRTAPRNARADESVTRVTDGTHANGPGYRQIGDSIYCWMKAMIGDGEHLRAAPMTVTGPP